MLAERAKYLRDLWQGKPCPHPKMETEYFKGKRTGNQTCTSCGKELTDAEVRELEGRNKNRSSKANNPSFERPETR